MRAKVVASIKSIGQSMPRQPVAVLYVDGWMHPSTIARSRSRQRQPRQPTPATDQLTRIDRFFLSMHLNAARAARPTHHHCRTPLTIPNTRTTRPPTITGPCLWSAGVRSISDRDQNPRPWIATATSTAALQLLLLPPTPRQATSRAARATPPLTESRPWL